ncbi:TerC/Alx family metal homeostasis membrane protein [Campylobacter gastrosuis]|uniref:TerC/Alx family metal homeostasis membrane protein n=1 Tax=Campylobacter gastrosuis TaxID=2974576 RepID=A0ABT7HS40_9BACT|nr:TerC/Alx family metal homeostasis membrane protein [Campylobacter gastrosuis]MDL0089552.1 TerC/Alx family metal homeostasis membrane protein [Campylobacter gastrosuis]
MQHFTFYTDIFIVFILLAIVAFGVDIFAHRKDEKIKLKSAILWSFFYFFIALIFGFYVYYSQGKDMASLYFTGYALEKALSVDNLFVMMAIFAWFKIPEIYRHRVLYYGILGAIVFRLIFVAIGSGLLLLSVWVEILFALIVAYTGYVMLTKDENNADIEDYSNHFAYKMVYKIFPVFPKLVGHNFFVSKDEVDKNFSIKNSILPIATPLFLCLCVIEISDVMFAFDSVPAIIAVSREPLIVYSAMIFAILGLRSLYFVLEALKGYLVHLEKAVIILLFFISFKLALSSTNHIFHHGYEISATNSLYVVLIVLLFGVLSSFIFKPKTT